MVVFGVMYTPIVGAAEETPTYNAEVGSILLDNCASCHRPNQIAPMSLLSYRDARPWARAIKAKVEAREMPPWFTDPRYGEFANDTSLGEDQIATIVAWVDGGTPEGDGRAPEPPQFSAAGWSHPDGLDPDFVLDFPVELQIDADGELPNFNLFTPLPFDDVMWVSATQVRPDNLSATHHIVTRLFKVPEGMKVGSGTAGLAVRRRTTRWSAIPTPTTKRSRRLARSAPRALRKTKRKRSRLRRPQNVPRPRPDSGPTSPVLVPRSFRMVSQGGFRGDLFKHIAWNLHYQSTGKPETARPQIGAWLADSQSTTVARALHLREYTSENKTLVAPSPIPESERQAPARFRQAGQGLNPLLAPIPANDGNWTVTGIGAFQNDAVIQNLFIHAHVRGKDFTYVLIYPDGREEILLRVPKYSFDWQYTYHLLDPVQAPAGSTIKVVSRYDNSRANRSNPAPHKEAYWWEQSWDDMFLATVGYTLAEEVKPTGATEE